jgi:hypothetical protein
VPDLLQQLDRIVRAAGLQLDQPREQWLSRLRDGLGHS